MKRIFLIICFVALSSVGFAQGALIEMDSVSYDFGRVSRRGGDLRHDFVVRNVGSQALVITKATTTCTCLKVKYPKSPIPAGTESKIEVKYELGRKDIGVFHKVIKIESNSTGGTQLLTIHGNSSDE